MPIRLAPLALAAVLAVAVAVAGCGRSNATPDRIVIGAVEDAAKTGPADAKMVLARQAGYRAVVLSAVWTPPLQSPPPEELTALRTAIIAASTNGIRPIIAVYSFSSVTPTTPEAQAQFAAYAASIPREIPAVRDIIVGNEPNLNLFWMPQFGADGSNVAASAYLSLLAASYDALKAVSADINVIGGSLAARGSDDPNGSRPTHSPIRFIADLGTAYRASGRSEPVMDMFSIHPYPENSSIPPTFVHPNSTSVGIADYDKLVDALGAAFDGTAQPGSSLPIAYGEYGLQTQIPAAKAGAYTGTEQPTVHPIDEAQQAERYAEAIRLATCSPTVRMLLFFHVSDESQLDRLQTGVFYADDTPKSSLAAVAAAAAKSRDGDIDCD